jgi:DNA-binding transcriptional regulator YhcF (GntR family)
MTPTFGPTSRQAWICQHFTDRILNGDLAPGDELPGIGTLAKGWGVSATTAHRALVQLRDERWIVTRAGKPSVVAPTIPGKP